MDRVDTHPIENIVKQFKHFTKKKPKKEQQAYVQHLISSDLSKIKNENSLQECRPPRRHQSRAIVGRQRHKSLKAISSLNRSSNLHIHVKKTKKRKKKKKCLMPKNQFIYKNIINSAKFFIPKHYSWRTFMMMMRYFFLFPQILRTALV